MILSANRRYVMTRCWNRKICWRYAPKTSFRGDLSFNHLAYKQFLVCRDLWAIIVLTDQTSSWLAIGSPTPRTLSIIVINLVVNVNYVWAILKQHERDDQLRHKPEWPDCSCFGAVLDVTSLAKWVHLRCRPGTGLSPLLRLRTGSERPVPGLPPMYPSPRHV